jgi:hypothetical protein
MSERQDRLTENATALDVPGVAAAILHDGRTTFAFHGVTSIEDPASGHLRG